MVGSLSPTSSPTSAARPERALNDRGTIARAGAASASALRPPVASPSTADRSTTAALARLGGASRSRATSVLGAVVSTLAARGLRWTYGTSDSHHFDARPAGMARPLPAPDCGPVACE